MRISDWSSDVCSSDLSALVTLGVVEGLDLWWELATLVAIMLLGHWIEMRSINQAQGALKELVKRLPDMAVRLDEAGTAKEVPVRSEERRVGKEGVSTCRFRW